MSNAAANSSAPASWRTHAAFLVASTLACLAWSWYAGRDLNWDQLNYHFYSAYHFLEDRLEQDFMGASIQGYLNPLAYVPFYLMVRANWPSLLIGSVLALAHSTCLWLVYGISRELVPAQAPFRIGLIAAPTTRSSSRAQRSPPWRRPIRCNPNGVRASIVRSTCSKRVALAYSIRPEPIPIT